MSPEPTDKDYSEWWWPIVYGVGLLVVGVPFIAGVIAPAADPDASVVEPILVGSAVGAASAGVLWLFGRGRPRRDSRGWVAPRRNPVSISIVLVGLGIASLLKSGPPAVTIGGAGFCVAFFTTILLLGGFVEKRKQDESATRTQAATDEANDA